MNISIKKGERECMWGVGWEAHLTKQTNVMKPPALMARKQQDLSMWGMVCSRNALGCLPLRTSESWEEQLVHVASLNHRK